MNSKAIMTSFLITVILAIIIFVPTCYGFSKLFRLSDQAKESFDNFADAVAKLPASEQKKTSEILILDQDTFVIAYNANKNAALCTAQNQCGESLYPAEECQGKSCLCLCQKFEDTGFKSGGEDIPCINLICKTTGDIQFASGLLINNFYVDKKTSSAPNIAEGYFQNGFMIVRGELAFSGFRYPFETIRRQFFFITAEGNTIFLCKKEQGCKIRGQP